MEELPQFEQFYKECAISAKLYCFPWNILKPGMEEVRFDHVAAERLGVAKFSPHIILAIKAALDLNFLRLCSR